MDQAGFTKLFMENRRQVLAYVRSFIPDPVEAEEVLQSTAVALWQKSEAYDATRPFTAWAFRFALIEVRRYRDANRHRSLHLNEEMVSDIASQWSVRENDAEARRDALRSCLQRLGKQHRDLVYQRYYGDHNVRELAVMFDESDSTLYKTFRRIRRTLLVCISQSLNRGVGSDA